MANWLTKLLRIETEPQTYRQYYCSVECCGMTITQTVHPGENTIKCDKCKKRYKCPPFEEIKKETDEGFDEAFKD